MPRSFPITGAHAWAVLAGGVYAYDRLARPDEQLSDTSHRFTRRHPVLAGVVIGVTGLHLAGLLPPAVDPYHQLGSISFPPRRAAA